jgi:hypothetical protein
MKIEQTLLIDDLIQRTRELMTRSEAMGSLPTNQLNYRNAAQSWCALECLEHVNLLGDFYLDEIEKRIGKAKGGPGKYFHSGVIGGYLADAMLPKNGAVKKVKSFRSKDPMHTGLPPAAIDRYLEQQHRMIGLLELAREVDLGKVRVSISISRFFKLKLGDVFRLVIYHNQRHMLQADNVLKTWEVAGAFV